MNSSTLKLSLMTAAALSALALGACKETTRSTDPASQPAPAPKSVVKQDTTESRAAEMITGASKQPTLQQAKEFLEASEIEIAERNEYGARVAWINANFITYDSNWLESRAAAEYSKMVTRMANDAKRFNGIKLPADMARKMEGLKRGSNFPAPDREGAADQLAKINTTMNSTYGQGAFEIDVKDKRIIKILDTDGDGSLDTETPEGTIHLGQASDIIAKSRDPELLQSIWEGWRTISVPMKKDYSNMVKIVNEGARELGFKDTGTLWRAGYDMPADDFTKEADRLWSQVKPLYDELHCYVRAELNEEYGDEIVPLDAPIRADLLGNMWGQSWGNVYDIVKPDTPSSNVDLTQMLLDADYDQLKMVQTGEAFFMSMGFEALPDTFWERSLITKPADRDVVCHASAWDLDDQDDIRIKMCTKITGEDFQTVHHELGHNIYQRAYKNQPVYYKTGANDGFHEAIGDMIGLSITPDYLVKIGLMDEKDIPAAEGDIDLLMKQALEKVAFLPFGLMVDQWRWKVFSGEYSPEEYNSGWWELREKYQGLQAPGERSAEAFDPGAKYHIPGNTPYMRYFLAHILQFQFHEAACEIAGAEGPLHRCSVYDNQEVGAKFKSMMQMGASKPWPDALEAFTGTRNMDGSSIVAYFDPLMTYLKEENKDRSCGWE